MLQYLEFNHYRYAVLLNQQQNHLFYSICYFCVLVPLVYNFVTGYVCVRNLLSTSNKGEYLRRLNKTTYRKKFNGWPQGRNVNLKIVAIFECPKSSPIDWYTYIIYISAKETKNKFLMDGRKVER